jgi:hypothetical protein
VWTIIRDKYQTRLYPIYVFELYMLSINRATVLMAVVLRCVKIQVYVGRRPPSRVELDLFM